MGNGDLQKDSRLTTQQFSIALPHDMPAAVDDKIKPGHHASVSEASARRCARAVGA